MGQSIEISGTKNTWLSCFTVKKIATLMLVLTISVLAGCQRDKPPEGKQAIESAPKKVHKPFRIAIVTWVGHGPFYLGKAKGFFKKRGLDIDIQLIEDIGARRSALLSKNLEGIISSVDAFAVAAARKLPAKTIMKLGEGDGADGIVAKQGITSLKDIKGHSVAFPRGEPSHFFLLMALEEVGLSSKDIEPKYMTAGDAGAAFVAGNVDVCVTWEPWVTTAKEKGKGNILATSKDRPGVLVDSFLVRKDVLKERPNDVKEFMLGWFDAIEYWKKHPDEANTIMAKSLGIPKEDFVAMLSGYKFSDYKDNLKYFGTKDTDGQYWDVFEAANRAWLKEKIIETPGKPVDFTDIAPLRSLY